MRRTQQAASHAGHHHAADVVELLGLGRHVYDVVVAVRVSALRFMPEYSVACAERKATRAGDHLCGLTTNTIAHNHPPKNFAAACRHDSQASVAPNAHRGNTTESTMDDTALLPIIRAKRERLPHAW